MSLAVFLHPGKTVLINNIADNICLNGYPVLFFSYDDGRAELRYRTYCRFSGFDIEDFNKQRFQSDLGSHFRKIQMSANQHTEIRVRKGIQGR